MQVPRPVMDKDLKAEEKELTDDINSLVKKVRDRPVVVAIVLSQENCSILQSKYLEKQFNEAQAQVRDIVCTLHPFAYNL